MDDLERILTGLDCFCITTEPFRPNGKFQPGQDWKTEADSKAARHVFQAPSGPLTLPSPPGGERVG